MAVVNVTSPAGKSFQFEISGSMPSPEEQSWIDQYVAQQSAPAPAPKGDGGGFFNAIGTGVDQMQGAYGSALEGAAGKMGLDGIAAYGRSVADGNNEAVQAASGDMTQWDEVDGVGSFVNYGLEQIGQQIPNYGATWGARGAGIVGGGAMGAPFGPVGAGIGALIGGVFAPYAVNTAQMYGSNRERQRDVNAANGLPQTVDEGSAFGTALGQGAIDTAGELLPIAKFLPKPLADVMTSGGVAKRIAKGIGLTAAAEVPVEVLQQVAERWQAGLPIDNDEAMAEYAETARATLVSAGAIGGVTNAFNPDSKRLRTDEEAEKKQKELLEDSLGSAGEIRDRLDRGLASLNETGQDAPPPAASAPPLLLPSPTGDATGAATGTATPPLGGSPAPTPNAPPVVAPAKPFMWSQYQAALSKVAADGKVTIPVIQQAAKRGDTDIVTPEQAVAIRDEMVRRGVLKKFGKDKFKVEADLANRPADPLESYRRTIEDATKQEAESTLASRKAMEDARREYQTGKEANARKLITASDQHTADAEKARQVRADAEARIARLPQDMQVPAKERLNPVGQKAVPLTEAPPAVQERAVMDRSARLTQALQAREEAAKQMAARAAKLKQIGKKVQLNSSDKAELAGLTTRLATAKQEIATLRGKLKNPDADVRAAQEKIERDLAAENARIAVAKAQRAAVTPIYSGKQQEVFNNLRDRMNRMNLKDVRLVAERMLNPEEAKDGSLVEGTFNISPEGKKVIAVAMSIYDDKMTGAQLFDAMSGIIDHEVIHALKAMGLFTDGEWKTLVEVAKRQKYVKSANGKNTQRSYTYHDRAASMYANQDAGIIDEEAVAEMFRDYNSGKLKIGGKPRGLFERMKDFFRSIWSSHRDAGFKSVDDIFQGINTGDVGSRIRSIPPVEDRVTPEQASSMRQAVRNLLAFNKDRGTEGLLHLLPAPVKKNGKDTAYFGTIYEGDTPIPIVFPKGYHTDEVVNGQRQIHGLGLTHIFARNHHTELFAQSKYKSISQAIYDLLYRWDKQTSKTGEAIEGRNHEGNITLEWNRNLPYSSGPLTLVLSRHINNGTPVYAVKTFYPQNKDPKKNDTNRRSARSLPNEVPINENDWNMRPQVPAPDKAGSRTPVQIATERFAARAVPSNPQYGQLTPDDMDNLTPTFFRRPGWALLTATSDRSWQDERFRAASDRDAHESLIETLKQKGIPYRTVQGMYEGVSDGTSYLILADEDTARRIGASYDQESVLTNRGLIYSRHPMPRTIPTGGIFTGEDALSQDYYSQIGDNTFAMGLDLKGSGPTAPDIGIGFYERDDRPQLPIRATDGLVELHHWSDKSLDVVDPQFAGTGPFNSRDRKSGSKTSFFGINPRKDHLAQGTGYVREQGLGPIEHIALVKPETLYPYFLDPMGLAVGIKRGGWFQSEYEAKIKNAGYAGYYTDRLNGESSHGKVLPQMAPLGNVAVMFGPTPVRLASEVQLGLRNETRYSKLNANPNRDGVDTQKETKNAGSNAATASKSSGSQRTGNGRGWSESGSLAPLAGAPNVQGYHGPDPRLVSVAEQYAASAGIDLRRQSEFVEVDPERGRRIAKAYEEMENNPSDPKVAEAYADLIEQTKAQYQALVDAGYKFDFFDGETDPYEGNPWNAMRDLRKNQKMSVYGTYDGYGEAGITPEQLATNPMLADTGLRWPDQTGVERMVTANDLFRAVHDAFGHGLEGSGFRARGEENAWQAHVRLFHGPAVGAITSETRGQNSWLNFNEKSGEANQTAGLFDTEFAEQKTGLMPEWTWTEGRAGDEPTRAYRQSVRNLRQSVSPTASQVQQMQKGLMYARASDLIAKILNLKGYGLADAKAKRISDGLLRRFQDNMLPVGRMIQELSANGMTITDAMDTYLQEELMHGIVGAKIGENQTKLYQPTVEAVKKINVSKAQIDTLIKLTNPMAKGGRGFVSLAMEDSDSPRTVLADAFLYARHAKERNAYILANKDKTTPMGSGMSDNEANTILRFIGGLDANNLAAFKALDAGVKAVVANTNKTRLEAGLIGQEAVDANPYQSYVPLRGFADNDDARTEDEVDTAGPPSRPRFGARGREDRKALGRGGYADDMLANVFTQNQNAILRGERNKVGQSLIGLIQSDPTATAGYAEVLPKAPRMKAEGPDGKPIYVKDPRAYDDPKMLVVKVDGKETWVKFTDPRIAGAMNGKNGMSPGHGSMLIKAMSKVNRYLANINTSYNPEFMVANFLRDLQTAGVNVNQFEKAGLTKAVLGSIGPALKGIKKVIRNGDDNSDWSKVYKDYVANGGQNATNQFNSLADEMAGIKKMLGDISDAGVHGRINKVRHGFLGKTTGSMLKWVEDYNTVIENGVRVATYKALLDRGMTPQRAAQAARNVTVNFAKGGDYRQFMGAWYLFYNASLQGSFALLNGAIRSPKVRKLWAAVVAAGLLQDQLNALLSDDDDDGEKKYDKIPPYVLEHNFILPDPFGITDRSYISIPMPYGLNMAHNLGRAMSRASRGAYDAGEATSSIFGTILDAVNPIGGFESFANFVAPTIADPFVDLMENEDFSGKPVYKENMAFDKTPAPNSQLYWQTTSPVATWTANKLNELTGGNRVRPGAVDVSPDIMEYWFDYATGGVGRFVQRSVELPFRVMDGGLTDELVSNIPFVRKTVGSVSSREDQTLYIETSKEVLMAGEELKKAQEAGDIKWAKDTMSNYMPQLRMLGMVRNTETALKKISNQRNKIMSAPIPDDQRRAMMKMLEERKQMLIKRANAAMRELH